MIGLTWMNVNYIALIDFRYTVKDNYTMENTCRVKKLQYLTFEILQPSSKGNWYYSHGFVQWKFQFLKVTILQMYTFFVCIHSSLLEKVECMFRHTLGS